MFNLIGIDALDRVNRAGGGEAMDQSLQHKHRGIFRLRNALSSIRSPILRGTGVPSSHVPEFVYTRETASDRVATRHGTNGFSSSSMGDVLTMSNLYLFTDGIVLGENLTSIKI